MIMVSLVMMVGGAGRDVDVNIAYLGPHFANDFDMSTTMVGVAISAMQAGGAIGPIALGWISDRVSQIAVIQVSLALSAVATVWLAFQGAYLPFLLLNLVFYGIVTRSRMTLTQAMVADALPDEDRDAAFSAFLGDSGGSPDGQLRVQHRLWDPCSVLHSRNGADAVRNRPQERLKEAYASHYLGGIT